MFIICINIKIAGCDLSRERALFCVRVVFSEIQVTSIIMDSQMPEYVILLAKAHQTKQKKSPFQLLAPGWRGPPRRLEGTYGAQPGPGPDIHEPYTGDASVHSPWGTEWLLVGSLDEMIKMRNPLSLGKNFCICSPAGHVRLAVLL